MPDVGPFILPALFLLIVVTISYVTAAWVLKDKDDLGGGKPDRKTSPRIRDRR